MISLTNYDFQWARSELVMIYPCISFQWYGDPLIFRLGPPFPWARPWTESQSSRVRLPSGWSGWSILPGLVNQKPWKDPPFFMGKPWENGNLYGKIHHFYWVNQLFRLGHGFYVAKRYIFKRVTILWNHRSLAVWNILYQLISGYQATMTFSDHFQ